MTEVWRYIDCGPEGPFDVNARSPLLGMRVAETGQPAMTTSVGGVTHLNVGWFDDVDANVDLAKCAELGVQVIRRPVFGGGTAFYDKDAAVMWGWLLPKATHPDLDAELTHFQPIFMDALHRLGITGVRYEGSSDLRIEGRKLGAVTAQDAVSCNSVGGFINTRQPDIDLYLAVARVPEGKFKDKLIQDRRQYVVTAEELRGRPLGYEEFRDALVAACEDAGMKLDHVPLTDEEREGLPGVREKIGSDRYLRRVSSERFRAEAPPGTRVGFGAHKGRKLCQAGVALDGGGTVAAAMMAGDMHVGPPDTMKRVAAALVGTPAADTAALRSRIAGVFDGPDVHQPDALMGVTTDDLLTAVEKAVAAAETAT